MGESKLNIERHIQYWQRCLKTLLPTQYTSTDSSRMSLGFFILSALDLLGAGADTIPDDQRAGIRDWILQCQHPNGGFCGSPNHRYPDELYADVGNGREQMDPANLPATCFAILSLSFVGTLEKVKRKECLKWLKSLQREDGSFGELITKDGKIEGGRDMRYCFVAMGVRWMLRGDLNDQQEDDIDIEKLVGHLRAGQTYEGGISESSEHEAHAGYTYCAISSLSLLHRLPLQPNIQREVTDNPTPGLSNLPATIRWLVSRQLEYFPPTTEEEEEGELPLQDQRNALAGIHKDDAGPLSLDDLSLNDSPYVGFNGRFNKQVDTCYTFWVAGSLSMIGQSSLIDVAPIRRFLFEQTQHRIGGFGKYPGNPPDIYHSYLGLAALATMKEPGLKDFDPELCISIQARENINNSRKTISIPTRIYWKHGYSFPVREDDPLFEEKMSSSEEPPKSLRNAFRTAQAPR